MKNADGDFTERNGWHDVIDLNFESPQMRNALIDAMKFWVNECDIDGFRCDMAHLVPLDFWIDARRKCDALKSLCWLAECEVVEYHEAFDISYAWEWMHITEKMMKGFASLEHFKGVIEKYQTYPANAKSFSSPVTTMKIVGTEPISKNMGGLLKHLPFSPVCGKVYHSFIVARKFPIQSV